MDLRNADVFERAPSTELEEFQQPPTVAVAVSRWRRTRGASKERLRGRARIFMRSTGATETRSTRPQLAQPREALTSSDCTDTDEEREGHPADRSVTFPEGKGERVQTMISVHACRPTSVRNKWPQTLSVGFRADDGATPARAQAAVSAHALTVRLPLRTTSATRPSHAGVTALGSQESCGSRDERQSLAPGGRSLMRPGRTIASVERSAFSG